MVEIYCRGHHQRSSALCEQCDGLYSYAMARLDRCPYKDDKPTCKKCPVHCYKKDFRAVMRQVMVYAGPRMLISHPVLAIRHLLDERRPPPAQPARSTPQQGRARSWATGGMVGAARFELATPASRTLCATRLRYAPTEDPAPHGRRAAKSIAFAAQLTPAGPRPPGPKSRRCTLGTLRRDGWPRISPCEVYFVGNDLLLGMMPESGKALDLRRDPRIALANGQSERIPKRGDFKVYGRAIEIFDQPTRDAIADAQEAAIDWRPTDPFHVFAVDIASAGYISFGEDRRVLRWSPEHGLERLRHPEG